MALKPCRECGEQVSTKAKTCPKCGVAGPAKSALTKERGCGSGCGLLLLMVVAAGVIGSLMPVPDEGSRASVSVADNAPYHARSGVNVRGGPSEGHEILTTLQAGDVVFLARPNAAGWSTVHADRRSADTLGFVYRSLLTPGPAPGLLLLNHSYKAGTSRSSPEIYGDILNLTGGSVSYAQITCTLHDSSDRQIGTAFDNTSDLRAGATWRFGALVLEEGVTSYRCEEPEGRR